MKRILAVTLAIACVAVVPSMAATPPYKVPPGTYCKGVSKKKIPGQKKTPFAQCVVALAKINKNHKLTPKAVCAPLGKGAKNKSGKKAAAKAQKQCVAAGKKLKADL